MAKKASLKEYGEWLFDDKSSIIYEKHSINEGVGSFLADLGQAGIAAIGTLDPTPTSDALNLAIYLSRGRYLDALFSFISIAPYIGDAIGKSGMLFNFLQRIISSGGRLTGAAEWVLRNRTQLKPALETLKAFITTHKRKIKLVFEYAGRKFTELRAAREAGSEAVNENVIYEQSNNSSEEDSEIQNLPQPVRMILDFILANGERLAQYFTNSNVVTQLQRAVDQAEELFSDLLDFINNTTEETEEETENPSINSPGSTALNEHVAYTDIRLKKLAGLIDR